MCQAHAIAMAACATSLLGVIMIGVTSGVDRPYNMLNDT
jgi:hypothetical protein